MAVHARSRPPLIRRSNPPRPSRFAVILNWATNIGALVFAGVVLYLIWPFVMERFAGTPAAIEQPTAVPAIVRPQPQPAIEQPAPIQEVAPVPAAPPAQPAQEAVPVAPPIQIEIAVPTPATIVKPDLTKPLNLAPGSIIPTATIAPTVATTAPMVAGKDFSYNKDGTCVETKRDGRKVKYCQIRPMNIGEMSSVADYLRTGMIQGEVVE